jgi:hypothetical protein
MNARPRYVVTRESEPLVDLETLQHLTKMRPGGVNQFQLDNGEMFVVMRRDDFEHLLNLAGIDMTLTG